MARTLADFGKVEAHGVIRDRLPKPGPRRTRGKDGLTPAGRGALQAALEAEGRRLREAAGHDAATILISVDQAEEWRGRRATAARRWPTILRAALAAATKLAARLTIRTDSFPELQSHRRFQDLEARGYDLRTIPVFRFDSVVEEPAKRYGVDGRSALVDALMEDAPKEDALPLLAFALQRLWRQYAASGALTRDNYDKVGGLKGLDRGCGRAGAAGIAPDEDVPLPAAPPRETAGRSRGFDLRAGARPDQRSGRDDPAHRGMEQF